MKKILDCILVVEGKTDVAFLSNFIDAEFVITNGSCVSKSTIEYLKECSKNKKILVLTDPDFPGQKIRNALDEKIPNLCHVFIDKKDAIKGHKVGVAESNEKAILKALENQLQISKTPAGTLNMFDLFDLNLIGNEQSFELREKVNAFFHTGFANGKTLLKRLNYLGVSKKDLEAIL